MPNLVAILDLETVPDRKLWTPPEPEAALTPAQLNACEKCGTFIDDAEVDATGFTKRKCAAMKRGDCRRPKPPAEGNGKTPFPPKWAHQICVIGFQLFDGDTGMPYGGPATAVSVVPQEERQVLEAFSGFMVEHNPSLVTWNGRGFDIPVVQLRSLRHGIPQPWYSSARAGRYSETQDLDLADVLSHYQYGNTKGEFSLDSMARLVGLPGKNGFDGTMVDDTVKAGGIGQVEAYCKQDVVQTAILWLRYKLLRGTFAIAPATEETRGKVFTQLDAYQEAVSTLRSLWSKDDAFNDWNGATGGYDISAVELRR